MGENTKAALTEIYICCVPKNSVPTLKHGAGNVMVWGSVATSGIRRIAFIEGKMDRYKYKPLLEHNFELGLGWIFKQGNDPKHMEHIIKD